MTSILKKENHRPGHVTVAVLAGSDSAGAAWESASRRLGVKTLATFVFGTCPGKSGLVRAQ